MCCEMVWKFCEIWKILQKLAPRWAKFCEILSHSVRYGLYVLQWSWIFLQIVLSASIDPDETAPDRSTLFASLDKLLFDEQCSKRALKVLKSA